MSSMREYIERAETEEKKRHLQDQWTEVNANQTIHCWCGQKRSVLMAYRCLYCGAWFCVPCAEHHFGQSLQDWISKKRVRKRRELECGILTMPFCEDVNVYVHRDGRVMCNGHEVFIQDLYDLVRVVVERLKQKVA